MRVFNYSEIQKKRILVGNRRGWSILPSIINRLLLFDPLVKMADVVTVLTPKKKKQPTTAESSSLSSSDDNKGRTQIYGYKPEVHNVFSLSDQSPPGWLLLMAPNLRRNLWPDEPERDALRFLCLRDAAFRLESNESESMWLWKNWSVKDTSGISLSTVYDNAPHDEHLLFLYDGMSPDGPVVCQVTVLTWKQLYQLYVSVENSNSYHLRWSVPSTTTATTKRPVFRVDIQQLVDVIMPEWPRFVYLHSSIGQIQKQLLPKLDRLGQSGNLIVKKSHIDKAGLGLFTTHKIARFSIITRYDGMVRSHQEAYKLRKDDKQLASHMWTLVSMRWVVDGRYTSDGTPLPLGDAVKLNQMSIYAGQFVNSNHQTEYKQNVRICNVMAAGSAFNAYKTVDVAINPRDVVALLVSTSDIEAGDELFTSYGEDYWQ